MKILATLLFVSITAASSSAFSFGFAEKGSIDENGVKERIMDLALAALEEQYGEEEWRFSLSARWIPGRLLSGSPGRVADVKAAGPLRRQMTFRVLLDGEPSKPAEIELAVHMERLLPVARERILAGEKLKATDLSEQWVELPGDRDRLVESMEEVEGVTLRRTLAPGQPIRRSEVGTEYVVEAGEEVRLLLDRNGVRIEIKVEARQSGSLDEEIRLYSKETRKRYLGRVTGPGEAEWKRTL